MAWKENSFNERSCYSYHSYLKASLADEKEKKQIPKRDEVFPLHPQWSGTCTHTFPGWSSLFCFPLKIRGTFMVSLLGKFAWTEVLEQAVSLRNLFDVDM